MPAYKRSLAITDRYRRQFQQTNTLASQRVGQGFNDIVRVDNLDVNFRLFVPFAVGIINTARAQQVRLADAYVSRFATSELRRNINPLGISTDKYAGQFDQFGRPLDEALWPALYSTKLGVHRGYKMNQAVAFGVARITRITSMMVASAGRNAMSDIMDRSGEVRGWTRVSEGDACGACLALVTGEVLDPSEDLSEHPNCNCTAEPVIAGVRESVQRPTGQEIFDSMSSSQQDQLFAGRGGADKAQLLRDGLPLSSLVDKEPYALDGGRVAITEKPLSALTA